MKLAFPLVVLITSFFCMGIQYLIFDSMEILWSSWHWFLYLYFPALSLLINYMLQKQIGGRPQTFVTVFMGSMVAKLFFSLMVLLLVIYTNPLIKISFAISFLSLYLIFTILNTLFIFSKLKGQ